MKTKHSIEYHAAPYGRIATIPKGTPVIEASNLPKLDGNPQYWVEPWKGIEADHKAENWARNYGFLIESREVH